ncbi:MAG TPA: cytochrome c oxidase subunit II [Gemmatimonadaceae bacterium]|jgi:cytochrome c oxidase subunit 2|nr:cytochrome c oxidase subunit II [Gemmatimonadaceae bacterium]
MTSHHRSRRVFAAALIAVLAVALGGCGTAGPNSTLTPTTEFGREIDHLFNILFIGGIIVFVLVEAALLYTVIRYRRREGAPAPKHVHGNTTLEITWTLIPAVVLAFIAIPTVRAIFRTQEKAVPGALEVEVVGHQWWWEFRYPQYTRQGPGGRLDTLVTANELYLPVGRTANFALKTKDVIHSFWIPQLGGKRDLITNHTNYVWFTPESTAVWNGFCAEYCGTSHANMRMRAFTVTQEEFDRWVAHQLSVPSSLAPPSSPPPAAGQPPVARVAPSTGPATPAGESAEPPREVAQAQLTTGTVPMDKLPLHAIPQTPIPAGLVITGVTGDAAAGEKLFSTGACIACHTVASVPIARGIIGPNLTHFGSRTTIGAGLYPNDMPHLMAWIKDSPAMKPGSLMPALGRPKIPSGYTDQQIADIAAYLHSLK